MGVVVTGRRRSRPATQVKGCDTMEGYIDEAPRGFTSDEWAAMAVNRVAALYRQASHADLRVRRTKSDMAPAAVGQPVARSADPWRSIPDTDQRPEHWALWALRWVEAVRGDVLTIGSASNAADREYEQIWNLLYNATCSDDTKHALRNALRQCEDMHGWYGEALQAVDDLREQYDGWLSDMHRAYGTGGDDAALTNRLNAWRASMQYA